MTVNRYLLTHNGLNTSRITSFNSIFINLRPWLSGQRNGLAPSKRGFNSRWHPYKLLVVAEGQPANVGSTPAGTHTSHWWWQKGSQQTWVQLPLAPVQVTGSGRRAASKRGLNSRWHPYKSLVVAEGQPANVGSTPAGTHTSMPRDLVLLLKGVYNHCLWD